MKRVLKGKVAGNINFTFQGDRFEFLHGSWIPDDDKVKDINIKIKGAKIGIYRIQERTYIHNLLYITYYNLHIFV